MPIVPVDDLAHPLLADFSHANDVALRWTRGHGLYLAESAVVLQRAVRAGHRARAVLALPGQEASALEALGGDESVPVLVGDDALLSQLTGYSLHRGIVASMDRPPLPEPRELLRDARTVVVLDGVADPTNVGAIFRSVSGIGADAVLIAPGTADPFYRRAIRVSMGTVLQVPWTRIGALPTEQLEGFHLAALALRDDSVDLRAFAARRPDWVALVLGSEGHGLGEASLAACDTVVRIPMRHGIDSLNVAAASAVAIWAMSG
ncbi:TrmH family RNA methyltransferase [Arenivirga flava]|uniref:rRNA methyltransferase n=1 Tax=Arenivirga flava TaxID=1930060 RepID=A0AA37UK26_9MICO|nr:RNA methyltransferase [Arenivirga flava]GMA28115.1 rRNA methyltransferase [Arenivirga flava]